MSPTRPIRQCVFEALCEHPYGLTMRELIPVVWPNADDEPDNAADYLRIVISRMNRQFEKFQAPFRVRHGSLYRYLLWIRRVRK